MFQSIDAPRSTQVDPLMQIEVPPWIKENRLTSKVTTILVGGLTSLTQWINIDHNQSALICIDDQHRSTLILRLHDFP